MRGADRAPRRRVAGATPGADWSIRFRDLSTLPPSIEFSRPGNAIRFGPSGAVEELGVNQARFDFSPSGSPLGLLIEESRSNPLNTGLAGGSAGIPGTRPLAWGIGQGALNRSLDYGSSDGLPYVEVRFWGLVPPGMTNVTVAFSNASTYAATAGQTWTQSFFAQRVAGSWDNIIPSTSPLATNGSSGVQSFDEVVFPTTERLASQRFIRTATISNASATHIQPRFRLGLTANTTIDVTFRVAWPQLSQHAFSTSPIVGGATRATETALISGASFGALLDASRGAVLCDCTVLGFPGGSSNPPAIVSLHADLSNRLQMRYGPSGTANFRLVTAGESVIDTGVALPGIPLRRRGVVSWDVSTGVCRMHTNGVLVAEAFGVPLMTQLQIGAGPGSAALSAHIRELAGWRGRTLTSEQARRMSAVV